MKVLLADHLGMCFGVRDAIAVTRSTGEPSAVTVHGELVHNPSVLEEIRQRGFAVTPESERDALPERPRVLITAHGISNREKERLVRGGKELIDTTCPLVRRVHEAALSFHARGYFVVVIGRRGHVEVEGVVGDLDAYTVVETREEVQSYAAARIGVLCQSTMPPREAQAIYADIEKRNPGKEIRFENTICQPTIERQQAVEELLGRVGALVVVGGRNSNNTRWLGSLAERRGMPWFLVEKPDDLDADELRPFETIGLTAGTSTPDHLVRSVHEALLAIDR